MTVAYYYQVLGALVLIAALLYVVYRVSCRYKTQLFQGELSVTDRISVEKGVSVVVVSYKKKSFMLGVSSNGATLLQELSG